MKSFEIYRQRHSRCSDGNGKEKGLFKVRSSEYLAFSNCSILFYNTTLLTKREMSLEKRKCNQRGREKQHREMNAKSITSSYEGTKLSATSDSSGNHGTQQEGQRVNPHCLPHAQIPSQIHAPVLPLFWLATPLPLPCTDTTADTWVPLSNSHPAVHAVTSQRLWD